MTWRSASALRKIVGLASWLYVTPLFVFVFVLSRDWIGPIMAELSVGTVFLLGSIGGIALSDLVVEMIRGLKPDRTMWSDRKHFLIVAALSIPISIYQVGFLLMMHEFGDRLGQP